MSTHAQAKLVAGSADVIITPPEGTQIIHRVATDIHDDLHARVLVFGQGSESVAIVGIDFLVLAERYGNEICARAQELCQIDPKSILLCCSHTHSSPVYGNFRCWDSGDSRYIEQTVEAIARAIADAATTMEPIELAYGDFPMQIGYNRRLHDDGEFLMDRNPDGPVDRRIRVLRIKSQSSGEIRGILFSHGSHPVVIHRSTSQISADYPGSAATKLLEHYEKASSSFCPVFALGCAGDSNPDVVDGSFADLDRIGGYVAWATQKAVELATTIERPTLSARSAKVELPVLEPDLSGAEATIAACEEERIRLNREIDDPETVADFPECGIEWSHDLRDLAKGHVSGIPMVVKVVSFGDELCVVALQAEVFTRYQEIIAEDLHFKNTFVLSCTGGSVGYLPTEEEFDRGGYEVAPTDYTDPRLYAFKYYGTLALHRECESVTRKAVRDAVDSMGVNADGSGTKELGSIG